MYFKTNRNNLRLISTRITLSFFIAGIIYELIRIQNMSFFVSTARCSKTIQKQLWHQNSFTTGVYLLGIVYSIGVVVFLYSNDFFRKTISLIILCFSFSNLFVSKMPYSLHFTYAYIDSIVCLILLLIGTELLIGDLTNNNIRNLIKHLLRFIKGDKHGKEKKRNKRKTYHKTHSR